MVSRVTNRLPSAMLPPDRTQSPSDPPSLPRGTSTSWLLIPTAPLHNAPSILPVRTLTLNTRPHPLPLSNPSNGQSIIHTKPLKRAAYEKSSAYFWQEQSVSDVHIPAEGQSAVAEFHHCLRESVSETCQLLLAAGALRGTCEGAVAAGPSGSTGRGILMRRKLGEGKGGGKSNNQNRNGKRLGGI